MAPRIQSHRTALPQLFTLAPSPWPRVRILAISRCFPKQMEGTISTSAAGAGCVLAIAAFTEHQPLQKSNINWQSAWWGSCLGLEETYRESDGLLAHPRDFRQ